MIGMSIAAGATAIWLVSLPADPQLHHFQMDPTEFVAEKAQHNPAWFAEERNAEIYASIAAVEARRAQEEFAQARNAEIDASIAAVEARRAQEKFAQARNAEIDASIAAVEARRAQEKFAQERNAEIDASKPTIMMPWVVPIASQQVGSFAQGDDPEHPWQP
jgi:hypothetical protein